MVLWDLESRSVVVQALVVFVLGWCLSHQVMSDSCDPMDCSPPASYVHGILQARILEWVTISFSRGSSWPRDWTWISCITDRFFTDWVTREAFFNLYESSYTWWVFLGCWFFQYLLYYSWILNKTNNLYIPVKNFNTLSPISWQL